MTENAPDSIEFDQQRWFVELLGQHERQLNAFVLALVPNWIEADEVVQQTRIRLWEQFDRYNASGDFGAWARSIAYYQVLTYRKQSGRRATYLSDEALSKLVAAAEASDDNWQRKEALAECLKQLSESQRELLAGCYSGTHSIRDVSQRVGRSFNAVRQTLFRLRQLLYRCIQRRLTEEVRA